MTATEALPVACTLAPGEYKNRLEGIRALNKDALRSHERRDLVLQLHYAPDARDRVREMVRKEQTCCAFLTFDVREASDDIRVTITAPAQAREAAHMLFEQLVAGAPATSACGCATSSGSDPASAGADKQPGTKVAAVTAGTLATAAVACGACCVLPFALPAAVLAGTGGVLTWFASVHVWVTWLAIPVVVGAWGWIVWQIVRTRRRPAASTLYVMVAATLLMAVAVLWPLIEPQLVRALRV
jgi:hypothetical protein